MAVFRGCHFSPVLPDEPSPFCRGFGVLGKFHGMEARRQFGEPHVEPVMECVMGLGHTTWRPANGSDASAFALESGSAEPDDAYGHQFLLLLTKTFIFGALRGDL